MFNLPDISELTARLEATEQTMNAILEQLRITNDLLQQVADNTREEGTPSSSSSR